MNTTTRRQRGQAGRARTWVLALVLLAGVAIAWWVWSTRGQDGTANGAAVTRATAASGAASGGAGGPGGGRRGAAGGINRVQPVSVAAVRRQDIRVTVAAIGTIAAANTAVVHAKVDGELMALHFKEGQPVRAGALLAEIDPRSFQIALAQAQGTLARDQAQLQNAKLDLERFRDLIAKDAAPKQQFDTQEALVRQLQGTVLTDQAQVDNAKLQLSYTKIIAPISGLAGLKQVDLGNMVHASDANGLLTIAQTQPVNVVFAVPDVHLPKINKRLKAGEVLRVEAWNREQNVKLADGQVASTDNAIDVTTGTIKLKAQFPNADNSLFPNQFVNVRLQLDTLPDSLAVPSAAVLRGSQGSYVYAVNGDGTVSMRPIRSGANDGDLVSVQGQLQPGESVVTDGADRLRDGAQIEVIAAAGEAASAAKLASSASSADSPGWMSRLPPDVAERVKAMSPEERRAWIQKRREERGSRQGGGAGSN